MRNKDRNILLSFWTKRCVIIWIQLSQQLIAVIILMVRLTHWGRVMHICVSKLTIIGSDNGLSPDRRQAIIWTNAGILLIGHLGTNFSEILIEILTFSFKKMRLKVSSAKRRPFCLGLNVLNFDPNWLPLSFMSSSHWSYCSLTLSHLYMYIIYIYICIWPIN